MTFMSSPSVCFCDYVTGTGYLELYDKNQCIHMALEDNRFGSHALVKTLLCSSIRVCDWRRQFDDVVIPKEKDPYLNRALRLWEMLPAGYYSLFELVMYYVLMYAEECASVRDRIPDGVGSLEMSVVVPSQGSGHMDVPVMLNTLQPMHVLNTLSMIVKNPRECMHMYMNDGQYQEVDDEIVGQLMDYAMKMQDLYFMGAESLPLFVLARNVIVHMDRAIMMHKSQPVVRPTLELSIGIKDVTGSVTVYEQNLMPVDGFESLRKTSADMHRTAYHY